MTAYQVLYTDTHNQRFSILLSSKNKIEFIYWRELQLFGFPHPQKEEVYSLELRENTKYSNERGLLLSNAQLLSNLDLKSSLLHDNALLSGISFNRQSFLNVIEARPSHSPLIFINCTIKDDIYINDAIFDSSIAFIDCYFEGNFKIQDSEIKGNSLFCNSRFKHHFSLKNTKIYDSLHMEGCNFSGAGGASFRGLEAKNAYIDLGIKGCDDMFWLNEMKILGTLSIGGTFSNGLEILGDQEASPTTHTKKCHIGKLAVGVHIYERDPCNSVITPQSIISNDVTITEAATIRNTKARRIHFQKTAASKLLIQGSSVQRDVQLDQCLLGLENRSAPNTTLSITDVDISRHLKISNSTINGLLDLSNTAVNHITYLSDIKTTKNLGLNIYMFSTTRFLISPVSILFGAARRPIFSPKSFSILKAANKQRLGDAYCSLKYWLADTGHLEMEDVALFHMRDNHCKNTITKLILGRVFGWGVRLRNIAISSLIIILIFAGIFSFISSEISFLNGLLLSSQSFISNIFGPWEHLQKTSVYLLAITTEATLGVIFITVFVGAYIRKLLR